MTGHATGQAARVPDWRSRVARLTAMAWTVE